MGGLDIFGSLCYHSCMREKVFTYLNDVGEQIGVEFYLVGGTVRDGFMGVESDDWDLVARGLEFPDLIEKLSRFGKTETTGQQFNVIRHFPGDRSLPPMEIALPRKEYSTGIKTQDFEARYDPNMPIEKDLERRDYSINSIAVRCSDGALIDPFDGVGDIERGILRMLHPESAKDDALRIVRGIRFMAKFGFTVTPDTDKQLRENVDLLVGVSGERFQKELLDMIVAPHVDVALNYMQSIGALAQVFPELEEGVGCDQNQYHSYDVWTHIVQVVKHTPSDDPYVKLAALFHDIAKPAVKWSGDDGVAHFYDPEPGQEFQQAPRIAGNHEIVGADMAYHIMHQRLKFATHASKRVAKLVREHMFIQGDKLGRRAARRFLARLENSPGGVRENMEALFQIREGDCLGGKDSSAKEYIETNRRFRDICREELERNTAFSVKDLALNGHDLMKLGKVGQEIGQAQKELLSAVIDDPELNTPEALTALITA